MTTLAADKKRAFGGDVAPHYADLPIIASDIVYEGAAVGESTTSGTYRPLSGGDTFGGFCVRRCDNATGSANDKKIRVLLRGTIGGLPITGVDNINDEGSTVYASDDDTFTLTSTTTNTAIGKLIAFETSGYGTVYFEAAVVRSI